LPSGKRLTTSEFTRQNRGISPSGSCPDFAGDPKHVDQKRQIKEEKYVIEM